MFWGVGEVDGRCVSVEESCRSWVEGSRGSVVLAVGWSVATLGEGAGRSLDRL